MIAIANSTNHLRRSSRSSGMLALEPPRHSNLPLSILSPGKHLIGSSEACAIRIAAEGVQPRHAMVLVGDNKILLKALDSKTWVNDCVVSETALRSGDRVSIGPITYLVRFATTNELLERPPTVIVEEDSIEPADNGQPLNRPVNDRFNVSETQIAPPETGQTSSRTVNLPNSDSATSIVPETQVIFTPLVSIVETMAAVPSPTQIVQQAAIEIDSEARDIGDISIVVAQQSAVDAAASIDDASSTVTSVPTIGDSFAPLAPNIPVDREPVFQDIQRQILALEEQSKNFHYEAAVVRQSEEKQRLAAREEELKQLAAELQRQSLRLRDRNTQIIERETDLERRQAQLAADNERLVTSAQATRKELADEYARQMALWQEWDAAYRRTTAELKNQLETVELRRASIQAENERLASDRAEIQRLQAEHEEQRRAVSAERVQATAELGELHSQRATFETERRQQLADLQEREAQVASERRALAMVQDELLAVRQQIEHDRTKFATERSAESLRREQEVREHTLTRIRLNEEETALQATRFDLDSGRRTLDEQRAAHQREREEFAVSRAEIDDLRAKLHQAEIELSLTRQSEQEKQARIDAIERDAQHRRADLEQWQKTLESQQARLESERNRIRIEQQSLDNTRAELLACKPSHATETASVSGHLHSNPNLESGSWSPVNDTVEELLGIYGVKPSTSDNPMRIDSIAHGQSRPDLSSISSESLAPMPPPLPVEHRTVFELRDFSSTNEPGFASSHDSNGLGHLTTDLPVYVNETGDASVNEVALEETAIWNPASELAVSTEFEPTETLDTAVAEAVSPSIDETLTDINQRFGFTSTNSDLIPEPVETSDPLVESTPSDQVVSTPSSDLETASDESPSDETGTASHEVATLPQSSENTLESLRAQLAQMFDLPGDHKPLDDTFGSLSSSVNRSESISEAAEVHEEVEPEISLNDSISDVETQITEPVIAEGQSVSSTEDSPNDGPASAETAEQVIEEEETPWTRRLRELSAVAQSAAIPAPPPAPPAPEVLETAEADNDEDEFSVEAQLARLLGRPLNTNSDNGKSPSATSPTSQEKQHSPYAGLAEMPVQSAAVLADRSHLREEPRHKQNKNAVREEVQSFRAVAQMSARKALAKHSWNNLRNDFYFATGLTSVSVLASAWYIGTYAYGIEPDAWKGLTCGLTTILCSQKLIRASSQLKLLRLQNSLPPVGRRRSTDEVEVATAIDVTAHGKE